VKIAVVSDVHDHVWNLRTALAALGEAEALLFCGDLCSPFVIPVLAEGFAGPVHVVFGNNDGDLYRITQNARSFGNIDLHGELFKGELGGLRVAVNHYPEIGESLAASGAYDLVCYGHDHRYTVAHRGEALLLNPGTLLGYDPASRADIPATFVIADSDARTASGYRVGPGGIVEPHQSASS
jgi:putative phosphoesterase